MSSAQMRLLKRDVPAPLTASSTTNSGEDVDYQSVRCCRLERTPLSIPRRTCFGCASQWVVCQSVCGCMLGTVAAGSPVHGFSVWQIAGSATIDPRATRTESLHSDRNDNNSDINQHAVIDDNTVHRGGDTTSKNAAANLGNEQSRSDFRNQTTNRERASPGNRQTPPGGKYRKSSGRRGTPRAVLSTTCSKCMIGHEPTSSKIGLLIRRRYTW